MLRRNKRIPQDDIDDAKGKSTQKYLEKHTEKNGKRDIPFFEAGAVAYRLTLSVTCSVKCSWKGTNGDIIIAFDKSCDDYTEEE